MLDNSLPNMKIRSTTNYRLPITNYNSAPGTISTTVERTLQIAPFLTNKPNLLDDQMNVSDCFTTNYEQRTLNYEIKTNPKQTQYKAKTKPIQTQFKPKQTQFYTNLEVRAGSIFMMPLYFWTLISVGFFQGQMVQQWKDSPAGLFTITIMLVLAAIALFQFLGLTLRSTIGHSIFRLAVVNTKGEAANRVTLLWRWAIVWLPLFIPMSFVALLIKWGEPNAAFILSVAMLLLWISAAVYTVVHPNRGLHDRLAGTWVVRR